MAIYYIKRTKVIPFEMVNDATDDFELSFSSFENRQQISAWWKKLSMKCEDIVYLCYNYDFFHSKYKYVETSLYIKQNIKWTKMRTMWTIIITDSFRNKIHLKCYRGPNSHNNYLYLYSSALMQRSNQTEAIGFKKLLCTWSFSRIFCYSW